MQLAVLDFCNRNMAETARTALLRSVALAEDADRLGYSRYWLAEHHEASVAHGTPEVLAGVVAGHTTRIRVGSGGVLLPHACPLRTAKAFRLLADLYPGRIDLGLGFGRAPSHLAGAFAVPPPTPEGGQERLEAICRLSRELAEAAGSGGRAAVAPEVWLLGSGGLGTAALAGRHGANFAVSLFRRGTASPGPAIDCYRREFCPKAGSGAGPRWSIAVAGVCADSQAEAEAIARDFHDPNLQATVVGDGDGCLTQLTSLAKEHGAEEIVFLDVCRRFEDRRRCYDLLSRAAGLGGRRAA